MPDDIREDIFEEEQKIVVTARRLGASIRKSEGNNSIVLEESEDVDGLIKWAKNLPDDIS